MKVAVYSPYLDTFGGGERYMLTLAEVLSSQNDVELLIGTHLASKDFDGLKKRLEKQLNLDLSKVNMVPAPIGQGANFLSRLLFFRQYDVFFFLSDGSIFYSTAKYNILHIQTPLKNDDLKSWWNRIKLSSWGLIIYNSKFTKDNVSKFWPVKSQVIYPPVDTSVIKPSKKENYIITVGRFFGYLKEKKHQFLIEVFAQLVKNNLKGWSLHLVGSASEGDKPYLEELKKEARGLPVFFYPNLEFKNLVKLYGQSKIYWHAMGYSENEPTKMEHFGITVVEAMAAGCVPVVVNKGGLKEIVEDKKNGFLWNDIDDLKTATLKLAADEELRVKLANSAKRRSKIFSKDRFAEEILKLLL